MAQNKTLLAYIVVLKVVMIALIGVAVWGVLEMRASNERLEKVQADYLDLNARFDRMNADIRKAASEAKETVVRPSEAAGASTPADAPKP